MNRQYEQRLRRLEKKQSQAFQRATAKDKEKYRL
jgi:hypothetical protein